MQPIIPEIICQARITSIAFFLATLPALALMAGPLGIRPEYRWLLPLLMLASPFYVFWSRTVMIETCALCFNCWFLAAAMHCNLGLLTGKAAIPWIAAVLICGSIGAMVKINAWFTFWLAALVHASSIHWHCLLAMGCVTAWCGILGVQWIWAGDVIKRRHPLSRLTQVSSLPVQREWNFGNWRMKLSPATWRTLMARNSTISAAGVLTCALLCLATRQWAGMACLGLYLGAFAVFTKVHHTHDYYACANGVFLVASLALGLSALQPWAVMAALALILPINALVWWQNYRPVQINDVPEPAFFAQLREAVPEDQVIVTLGLDWNPLLPLYVGRRALMLPDWPELTPDAAREAIRLLVRHGHKVGAYVGNATTGGITREWVVNEVERAKMPRCQDDAATEGLGSFVGVA